MTLPALLLFARSPRAGQVKTRLSARLGPDGAASLYRAFLEDAGRVYLKPSSWTSILCADPDPADPMLTACFPQPWQLVAQAPGDLGSRLVEAFERAFAGGARGAVAVGSDHPALPLGRLEELFGLLAAGEPAAIVPAEDGGYCAIALAAGAPLEAIFGGVAWSTDAVLAQTLERLGAAGIAPAILEPAYDVDRPEDLERLRRDLEARDPLSDDFPAATATAMRALAGTRP